MDEILSRKPHEKSDFSSKRFDSLQKKDGCGVGFDQGSSARALNFVKIASKLTSKSSSKLASNDVGVGTMDDELTMTIS